MGSLVFDGQSIEFDDPLLAHLQIVIVQKLSRGESLLVSWMNSLTIGDGRTSIWINPTLPLRFNFAGSRSPAIDRDWLAALTTSASHSTGLIVVNRDGSLARCGGFTPVARHR